MRKALQIAGMSLSALFGNWARSVLTTLGVVIGVAAGILIMSLGNGVQGQITGQFDDLGPNLITIAPGSGRASEGGQRFGGDGGGGPGGAEDFSVSTRSNSSRASPRSPTSSPSA